MVLGLRSKNRKGDSIQVDYLVHVEEIKPWPPSKSLKSVGSVLLQWENSDQNSGLFSSNVQDGKIDFNESFRLPVTLCKEGKSRTHESFKKNCLEFYLYEPPTDKAAKGQLLGSATINIADYGIVKETIGIEIALNCKKSFRNTVQPILFVKIQPFDNDSSASSSKASLSEAASLDKDGSQFLAELKTEENEETEMASFTDDDGDDLSSHSSRTMSSSTFEGTVGLSFRKQETVSESKNGTGRYSGLPVRHTKEAAKKPQMHTVPAAVKHPNENLSRVSSTDLSSDHGNSTHDHASLSKFPEISLLPVQEKTSTHCVKSPSSSSSYLVNNDESNMCKKGSEQENIFSEVHGNFDKRSRIIQNNAKQPVKEHMTDSLAAKVASLGTYLEVGIESKQANPAVSQANEMDDDKAWRQSTTDLGEATMNTDTDISFPEYNWKKELLHSAHEEQILEDKQSLRKKIVSPTTEDATEKQVMIRRHTISRRALGAQGNPVNSNKLRHVKSVHLPSASARSNEFIGNSRFMDKTTLVNAAQEDAHNTASGYKGSEIRETAQGLSDSKVELESRVEMLEEELREAAAVEVGLYSVVAEHGSSINKVHAPARRLSRFYLHACKARSHTKLASAARAAVSGLVLVSKACGNDVTRLTFWLSNTIVLRAIVSKVVGELPISDESSIKRNGGKEEKEGFRLSGIGFASNEEEKSDSLRSSDDWEDPQKFTVALEKLEAWIFSRIVESIWWQTLTPHMQSAAAKGSSSRKTNAKRYGLGDQAQGNFSIDLWKKAFKDACERLCPIRAGGHECGCLPALARLVMEQLVGRLDVAMFNAILRESAEEMPTDPVSDPISDSRVLPIPAGKSSFGAGAQLKNAIGNWSRWLTDLFGIDDNDFPEDENNLNVDKRPDNDASFKAFHLLNALSDLMMLPFEMLADRSTRKEVCPTFGAPLIRQVLDNFVPDEFFPDPIPASVFEALDAEDSFEAAGESISSFPVAAPPPVYSTPPSASLAGVIGEVGSQNLSRSGSSILKKSYTSDDELDELDSPLNLILNGNSGVYGSSTGLDWRPTATGGRNVVRYKLLREVWTVNGW